MGGFAMIDKMTIKDLVKQAVPDICAMRRHIHENPELSGEEVETAAFMAAKLRSFGIDVQEHVAGTTAVLGTLKGGKPGPVIALRADMDALPMTEETGLPFASNFAGKMHACGHDGHMSILLGAAEVLSQVKDDIPGTVVFICQPSEEKSPVGGAKGLVASGVLDGVDAVYGLHVWPTLPSGKIGVLPGPMMAASDHIRIVLNGKASHAAMPHKGVDTIVAAAQFLTAAQTIISRRVNPLYPAVLTFGKITGGTRYNVVADTVEIEGTCRTYHAEAQDAIEAHLQDTLKGIDAMYGTVSHLDYERGYAAVRNTPQQAAFVAGVAKDCFGPDVLAAVDEPAMTAEDFSGYLQKFDGGFFWLGATKPGDTVYPLHNTHFAVDEACLPVGVELMVSLVLAKMKEKA